MATDFNNKVTTGKPFIIGSRNKNDLPLDIRIRIETIDEVSKIQFPYIGMIFYVKDEDKYYSVKTLKGEEIVPGLPGTYTNNYRVDRYEELIKPSSTSVDLSEYAKITDVDNKLKQKADLSHTHKYEDIEGKPVNLSEFVNDTNFATVGYVDDEVAKCKEFMTADDADIMINEIFK